VKRFPFLDWMRGLAVVIMIQCHAFNAFVRMDLRDGGPYVLSQFVGGMAAPLFLFMAGMTTAFQMESLARREPSPWRRWAVALRRAAYIMGIAVLFRFTNWLGGYPGGSVVRPSARASRLVPRRSLGRHSVSTSAASQSAARKCTRCGCGAPGR